MKHVKLFFALFAMLALGVTNAWGETLTLSDLGAGLSSTSNASVSTTKVGDYTLNYLQGKKQGNSILLAKGSNGGTSFISNKTPIPGAIKSVTVYINSGASGSATYHCAFSTQECTSRYTTGSTAVNIAGGNSNKYTCSVANASYFCVSLGNNNNGQVLKLEIEYTPTSGEGGGETPEPEPEPDPETPEGAITCAEAVEVCQATGTTPTTDTYTIHGYVTSIKTAYSSTHGNISFWMADTKDGGEVLQCYRVVPVKDGEENVKVGDKVEVIGTLVNYNGNTPEVNADGTYTILEVAAGGETPDPEEPENPEDAPTYDFTNIDGFTTWGSSYSKHDVTYSDAVVTFASANKNGQTITDQPVTKGGDVSLVLTDGMNIATVKWVCTQWTSKAQTITLHYSKDGGNVYTSTEITSSDFTISSDNLPAGTNAVKITFSSTSNQVGIKSCTITKVEAAPITQVPAPLFSLPAGAYDGAQSVELTCTMADATIHYTTDGTTPTTTSPVYSTAIQVAENMTIKAYAVKEGLEDSPMVEATYEISAPADVILDFTDNSEWDFPTEKTVDATDYTNDGYTVTVAGSEGQGFMFDNTNKNLMIGKEGSYIMLPIFNKPIVKIVCEGHSSGSGSVTFNVFVDDDAVSTAVTGCKANQTFLIAEDKQVANVAHTIKVTNGNNVRFSKIKIYLGETISDGPTTGVDNVETTVAAKKAIINGQLVIVKDGVKFNALGQVIK